MAIKPILWVGAALHDLRAFPADARRRAGYELYLVQNGHEPSDWKPLPTVGTGVTELRIHARGQYRVLYTARFADGVYVLHAFAKKSRRTPKADIEIARSRLREAHLRQKRHK